MIVEHDVDCGEVYRDERLGFVALVRSLTAAQHATVVPATPSWTVLDVLAHTVAVAADLNAQHFGDGDADAWTASQVTTRRGRSVDDLEAEWAAEGPTFEAGLRLFGYEVGSHFLCDLVMHVADVRHALGLGRPADGPALVASLDFYVDDLHTSLVGAGLAMRLDVEDAHWLLGEGAPVASLAVGRFEALRAIGARRSLRQLRALSWTGDAARVLPLLPRYPPPATDLVEP